MYFSTNLVTKSAWGNTWMPSPVEFKYVSNVGSVALDPSINFLNSVALSKIGLSPICRWTVVNLKVGNEPSKILHVSDGGGNWNGSPTNRTFRFLCRTTSTIASKNLLPIN